MKQGWKSTSKRWNNKGYTNNNNNNNYNNDDNNVEGSCWKQMYGYSNNYYGNSNKMMVKKRVMVIVDETKRAKDAMMWALSNVTNKGDWLTLLHIVSNNNTNNNHYYNTSSPNYLVTSLASLCKASKPEVEVEALVIQGPKLETVLSQVKKLEVSVLVLGQKKPSSIMSCLFGMSNSEEFVKQCIHNAECLTIGVKKQSKGMGGFLISTRWQNNFWLLA